MYQTSCPRKSLESTDRWGGIWRDTQRPLEEKGPQAPPAEAHRPVSGRRVPSGYSGQEGRVDRWTVPKPWPPVWSASLDLQEPRQPYLGMTLGRRQAQDTGALIWELLRGTRPEGTEANLEKASPFTSDNHLVQRCLSHGSG